MRVLLLTNPEHKEFVSFCHGIKEHTIFIHDLPEKIESFDGYGHQPYDIGISFMYQYKVPAKEVNTHTWFNFHPAPLPEYKGRNLCYHAIMNGEKEFGASVHYMDENFDTGDIISVYGFDILPSDTAEDVSRKAISLSKEMFIALFPRILAGEEFERIPNVGGIYYSKDEIISNEIILGNVELWNTRKIRAITYPPHYPVVNIGGVMYKIIKDD